MDSLKVISIGEMTLWRLDRHLKSFMDVVGLTPNLGENEPTT